MSDYQSIPEQIRGFLASPGRRFTDEVADAAAAFSTLCREANDRLRRCGEYLRRGMRSEAVHLANCQPPLLELVPALTISEAERAEWERACAAEGLPPPPRLQADAIQHLKRAAERERALEPLLARHRVLALAAASVRDRLEVARALAGQDPDNPCWDEETRALEAARSAEMLEEAKAAFRAMNGNALKALTAELSAHAWRAPVPDDLRLGLERALDRVRRETALAVLGGLLPEMGVAYEARDYDRCVGLLRRWQETVESRRLAVPPELQQQVRPVAAWLAAEERRRAALEKMQSIQPVLRSEGRRLSRRSGLRRAALWIGLAGTACGGAAVVYAYVRHFHP